MLCACSGVGGGGVVGGGGRGYTPIDGVWPCGPVSGTRVKSIDHLLVDEYRISITHLAVSHPWVNTPSPLVLL